jgi:hypothetical protein
VAITSLALSGLFGVLLVTGGIIGLVKGAPVFWPPWILLLPISGGILGLLAQWHIRRAEGTLAGAAVGRWGWWLGLLSALGYGAYYFATGLALQEQANTFLMEEGEDAGFIKRLLKGDVNRAFILTQPFAFRKKVNPDDALDMEKAYDRPGEGGDLPLTAFSNSELVQAFVQAGREGQTVTPLGIRNWTYQGKSYKVLRTYRVTTEEGQADFLIPVIAEQDPSTGGRKWHVEFKNVAKSNPHPTALGQGLTVLRASSRAYLKNIPQGPKGGKKKTPPPKDATDWAKVHVLASDKNLTETDLIDRMRQQVTARFQGSVPDLKMGHVPDQAMCPWEETKDGHIRLTYPLRLAISFRVDSAHPEAAADARITLQTVEPVNPRVLPLPLHVEWQIVEYKVLRLMPTPMMKGK